MDCGGDHEFSGSQRAFVVEHKLAGKTYPSISRRFAEKYGFEALTIFTGVTWARLTVPCQSQSLLWKPRSQESSVQSLRGWFRIWSSTWRNKPSCALMRRAVSLSLGCKSSTVLPTNQWALFRANKNLKKSLSFIQSRVEYSRSYLRNLVVKINFDSSQELCNNSVDFSAREMFFDTFPLRIQRGI